MKKFLSTLLLGLLMVPVLSFAEKSLDKTDCMVLRLAMEQYDGSRWPRKSNPTNAREKRMTDPNNSEKWSRYSRAMDAWEEKLNNLREPIEKALEQAREQAYKELKGYYDDAGCSFKTVDKMVKGVEKDYRAAQQRYGDDIEELHNSNPQPTPPPIVPTSRPKNKD
jgi:hypothetical protein